MKNGKRWAYSGVVLGGGVSVAANIAHSFVPPEGAAPGWGPHFGAVALAAFWPAALFVAVEILARVGWPDQRRWSLLRWGGLVPLALVAAVVSYRHLSGLLGFYGEDGVTVAFGPLAVDGLMVVSTTALLALAGTSRVQEVHEVVADPEPAVTQEVHEPVHVEVHEPVTPDPLTQAKAVLDQAQPPALALVQDETDVHVWIRSQIDEGLTRAEIQRTGATKFVVSESTMKRRYTEATRGSARATA